MRRTSIYALHDPRDWAIRYVGKANHPERRLRAHTRYSNHTALRKFIRDLQSLGLQVGMSILATCSQGDWKYWEKFWIRTVRASGAKLFNIAEGGNAPATTSESCRAARLGKKDSIETRRRKSVAAKGKAKSPEHIAKVAASHRGAKRSDESVSKMRAAKLGTKRPEKFRINHSFTMREKWNDHAYREKVSAGLRESWRKRREIKEN